MTDDEIEQISERVAVKLSKLKPPDLESYVPSEIIEQHFGVSRATVHNWVHKEGCPHEMRGKILRFKLRMVDDWFRGRGRVLKSVP